MARAEQWNPRQESAKGFYVPPSEEIIQNIVMFDLLGKERKILYREGKINLEELTEANRERDKNIIQLLEERRDLKLSHKKMESVWVDVHQFSHPSLPPFEKYSPFSQVPIQLSFIHQESKTRFRLNFTSHILAKAYNEMANDVMDLIGVPDRYRPESTDSFLQRSFKEMTNAQKTLQVVKQAIEDPEKRNELIEQLEEIKTQTAERIFLIRSDPQIRTSHQFRVRYKGDSQSPDAIFLQMDTDRSIPLDPNRITPHSNKTILEHARSSGGMTQKKLD